MSRTDKTNPYRVKYYEKPTFIEEKHDHRNGVCDLPPRPKRGEPLTWRGNGECNWYPSRAFWHDPIARCACPMCGYDAYESMPKRVRQRREGKKYCNDGWTQEY